MMKRREFLKANLAATLGICQGHRAASGKTRANRAESEAHSPASAWPSVPMLKGGMAYPLRIAFNQQVATPVG
jgi:hypothetical protein